MKLATHPSLMFDTQILDNGTIQIPELQKWQNEEIHVIVIFKNMLENLKMPSPNWQIMYDKILKTF